jgi:hypothetical protein
MDAKILRVRLLVEKLHARTTEHFDMMFQASAK